LTENHQALATAFLAKHYGGVVGSPLAVPLGTVTSVDHHSLVAAHLTKYYGTSTGSGCAEPMHTITAGGQPVRPSSGLKMGMVYALLTKYYGQGAGQALQDPAATVTAKDRMGLVTVHVASQPYVIADIGLRMLQPRELFRAQGFSDSYIIGDDPDQGLVLTKTAQVRLCGNSVCPDNAEALVRANAGHLAQREAA
jgi:DNA (cytosine-5)-methyltransferase 1